MLAAKKYIPGLGKRFQIQADEIDAGVVIGGGDDSITQAVFASVFDTGAIDKAAADDVVAAGAFARSKIATDALAPHGVRLTDIMQPTGIPHDATGGAGLFSIERDTGLITLEGEVCDNTTKTDVCQFQYVLPDNYVAGGLITLRVNCAQVSNTGVGTNVTGVTSDIAVTCLKQAGGAVGSNLVASGSPQTFAAMDTWYDKDIVITPTGLVPGDVLNFQITMRSIDSNAGSGSIQSEIDRVSVLCDVAG